MQRQGASYNCARCRSSFSSVRAYNIHISVCLHRHICKLCPGRKELDSYTALQNHLEKFHLFCEPCHWFAPSALGLRQHNIARHFVCVACGDYFINAHELNGVRKAWAGKVLITADWANWIFNYSMLSNTDLVGCIATAATKTSRHSQPCSTTLNQETVRRESTTKGSTNLPGSSLAG